MTRTSLTIIGALLRELAWVVWILVGLGVFVSALQALQWMLRADTLRFAMPTTTWMAVVGFWIAVKGGACGVGAGLYLLGKHLDHLASRRQEPTP